MASLFLAVMSDWRCLQLSAFSFAFASLCAARMEAQPVKSVAITAATMTRMISPFEFCPYPSTRRW
ncbi:hypothetical protein D9M70_575360 [compost metagenome]